MRGYEQDEYEDYDDYEAEGYKQGYEQEEEGEEEEYEEEERKPTAEEQEYLELRARIKEQIRKKMQRENGSAISKSQDIKKKSHSDNYGSFFGPSQPVIAQRVIQESKSLLENPHLVFRNSNSHHNKETSSSAGTGSKNGAHEQIPKVRNELKSKVQKLKDTRDYSFLLSDDAEVPAPSKQPVPQNVSAPKSEARTAQMPQKSKQPSGNSVRDTCVGRDERKPIATNGQMHSKAGLYKSASTSRPSSTSMDSRRQPQINSGTGPGRPMASMESRRQPQINSGTGPGRPMASMESRRQPHSNNGTGPGRPMGTKGLPPKAPLTNLEKKASAPGGKTIPPAARKPIPSNLQSSVPRQQVEQRRTLQEPKKMVSVSKPSAASSKPQVSKPVKQISSRPQLQDNRPKKKPARPFADEDDEDAKALSMIRKMFNYNRFADRDVDDDLSDMEANFDDIMREERRSAKIAKKEDEEQLRLIEEEERRERMRKLAKKRKPSHQ